MHILEARPNFMKVAPVMRLMAEYPGRFSQVLVHTARHYDFALPQVFFRTLNCRKTILFLKAAVLVPMLIKRPVSSWHLTRSPARL